MAGIIADMSDDIKKLQSLKNEIENVKKALKGINIKVDIDIAKGLQSQLKSLTVLYNDMVDKIAQAEAKILLSAKKINDASEKIIQAQEKVSKSANTPAQTGNANVQANTAEIASIQAQAKAYDDLRTEINNILGTREENVKRMIDEMNAIRLINAEIKKINKSQGGYSSLSSAQQKRLEQLNNSLLTHKTALSEVRQALNNNAKLDNATATSMNGLSQSLSRMRIAYRELTEEERNSPIGKELLVSINQADTKIKELDATIGNHARNVGDYGKQWNGLSMSIQQVGRELPSLAYGPKVFFSAISNNLPILADEIKRARTEYELLKKSGQSAIPVWKQVVSSLFSWQTALTVGITLLALCGDKVVDWVAGLFNTTDATKPLVDVQKQLNEVLLKGIQSAQSEITKLDLLYKATQNAAKPIEERKKAIDELQKSYPDFFKNLSDEEVLTGKAADAYTRLSSAIIASARARAAQDKMTENAKKILENEEKITDAYTEREKAQVRLEKEQKLLSSLSNTGEAQEFQVGIVRSAQKKVDEIDKRIANFRREIYETNKAQHELAKNININDLVFNANSDSTSNQDSAANKLRQQQEKYKLLMNKQALEQSRAAEDLENQTEQTRINAMKEGNTRTLAQMELDHKKEMQQLDRQREDLLRKKIEEAKALFDANEDKKAAKDSNYRRKTFDGSNITLSKSEKNSFDNQKMYLNLKQSGEMQALLDKERQAWNEYLAEYGTFQEKKEAINSEYNQKISEASTKGEKASLEKEKQDKLKGLKFDELKSSINFADIFGNLDAQSTDAIKTLRDKLKEIIEKSAKDLKPTDLKALQEALQNMDLKVAERDPFSELKNGLDNYKKSAKAVEKAQQDLNTVQKGGEVITGTYIDKTGKICTKLLTQEQAEKNLTDAQRKKKETQMQLTQSVNSIGEKGQQVVQAGNNLVDMLTNLGIKIPESVTGALSGVGQIMDGLASIDITKPMSIITSVTGMLAGLGKTIGAIFGLGGDSNTKKYFEDLKEQLDGINKIYDQIIEKSKEDITFGEGFAAITAASDAMDTLNKKLDNYRSLARAGIEYKDGTKRNAGWHSDKNVGAENFARMSDLVGKNITSVYDLVNLEAEDLYTIMTKMPGAWGQMDEHVRTALEDIVACKDEATELGDALSEAITGVSFDSFYNGFIDQLSDMEMSSEEFADNFEGYLRKSIMASIVANSYKDQIQKLYNDWAKYGEDQIYSEDEINDLRDQQKKITDVMIAERENLANTFGWESSSTSQEASKKGFATMSQDTGEELNGRFTALQIAGEEIKNQNIVQSQSLNLLTAKADTILSVNMETRNIADDTRNIIANSYLELVQISENTGNSAKYLKDIKADIAEVKKNTSKL